MYFVRPVGKELYCINKYNYLLNLHCGFIFQVNRIKFKGMSAAVQ